MHFGNSGPRLWTAKPLLLNKRPQLAVCLSMTRIALAFFFVLFITPALADDHVRQVQEELRKRHLYFGEIDGIKNNELTSALRRYQTRKGFAVSGDMDADTIASLGLTNDAVKASATAVLPDVPVLRSETAREIDPAQRQTLESEAEAAGYVAVGSSAAPAPPAESPPPGSELTQERITSFIESYLRDGESDDAATAAQLKYYAFPLSYFEDGLQDAAHVTRDAKKYIQLWPKRKFMLASPVTFFATGADGEYRVEFSYAYQEQGRKGTATGNAKQSWIVSVDGGELKIREIKEEHVRPAITPAAASAAR